jgi:hypothetical protein
MRARLQAELSRHNYSMPRLSIQKEEKIMKPNTNYTQPEPELELIKASEITPTEVEWLWYPYIPFGKVTILEGDPGDGKSVPMASIKGAPITFDLDALTRKIREVSEGNSCRWPHYDRQLHDPVDDAITIDADIVLIEGNYLLLNMDGWRDLSRYSDYTIVLTADADVLRERLIGRKMKTGMTRNDAEHFVAFSDMPNVRLCLDKMMKADLELSV